jgi:AbrB family looped-hinge helix DNA binding protein
VTTVKVSRKHQIAVPAAARRTLGIQAGDVLEVAVEDGALVLRPRRLSAVEELRNVAPDLWSGVDAARYVRELRDEWSHRER